MDMHARYGHLNFRALKKLAQDEMVRGMPDIEHVDEVCDGCMAGKQHRISFPGEAKYRATKKLELVHGNLCGPVTPSRNKFFLLLVDDLSRYMWLTLLKTKDQAMEAFVTLQAWAEVEAETKVGTLRTDRGGEFTARAWSTASGTGSSAILRRRTRLNRTVLSRGETRP